MARRAAKPFYMYTLAEALRELEQVHELKDKAREVREEGVS